MKIEDITDIDIPLSLDEILQKNEPPFVITRDNWSDRKMTFKLERIAKDSDGRLRYFGRFSFDGEEQTGMRELQCTYCRYRLVKE